jgi:GrpB-like predicted nucleotidyltransferase (UPF0157 family)
MTGRPVYTADYDPHWPATFEQLRGLIAGALAGLALRIEHIGSTAVSGLAAKPIIDLDVVIGTVADLPAITTRLRTLGYQPEGDLGIPGREAFTTPPGAPSHHLYVCARDSRELARHLAFRDFLRSHPDVADVYAELKRSLASQFRDGKTDYAEAKAAFIEQALATSGVKAVPQGPTR